MPSTEKRILKCTHGDGTNNLPRIAFCTNSQLNQKVRSLSSIQAGENPEGEEAEGMHDLQISVGCHRGERNLDLRLQT
ncbi:hypothetical protein C2845_PM02G16320 [Panicum miliaceum]|uniref:Uncharacterized protein n=1 Tax=Panicum miliaceum TaxID=4540 RepID=A0A3L6S7L6_PANMI|nr:hypothetical protein C2845_PM02G16320 [Panicum miliaceum]